MSTTTPSTTTPATTPTVTVTGDALVLEDLVAVARGTARAELSGEVEERRAFSRSVVTEAVFAWPGLGQLAFQSLFARDLNLLLGIFFISSCLVVAVNILVDIVYLMLDPRIRVG